MIFIRFNWIRGDRSLVGGSFHVWNVSFVNYYTKYFVVPLYGRKMWKWGQYFCQHFFIEQWLQGILPVALCDETQIPENLDMIRHSFTIMHKIKYKTLVINDEIGLLQRCFEISIFRIRHHRQLYRRHSRRWWVMGTVKGSRKQSFVS